jgi:hypothetical protein
MSWTFTEATLRLADPDHPESALNSIPKAVLQRARGPYPMIPALSPLTVLLSFEQVSQYSLCSRPALCSPGRQAPA